jgi:hypothetical protein
MLIGQNIFVLKARTFPKNDDRTEERGRIPMS